jgi:hypothetical protein
MSEILTWNLNSVWGCRLDLAGSRHIPVTSSYSAVISLIVWQAEYSLRAQELSGFEGGLFSTSSADMLGSVTLMFDFSCLNSILDPNPSLALSLVPSFCTFTTLIITSLCQHHLHECIPLALLYPPSLSFPIMFPLCFYCLPLSTFQVLFLLLFFCLVLICLDCILF